MGCLAVIQHNNYLGLFDFLMAGILIFNLSYLRLTGNYTFVSYFGILMVMGLFLYLLVSGGVNNSAFVWYYTFPLLALFLLGTIKGMIASLLLLIAAVVFFVIEPKSPHFATYSIDLKMRIIPSFLVVAAYAYVFETMRAKSHRKLTANNDQLSQTIDELKRTRHELELSQQNLEFRVRKRTAELNTTNKELQLEIAERRRTENALNTSNERFITVLDSIDANIYVADVQTYEILFVNQKMAEIFGDDLVGHPCWKVVRGRHEPCRNCTNDNLFDTDWNPKKVHVWEYQNPKTKRWYIHYDRVLRWTDGRWVKLQVATDVTDRKLAEVATIALNDQLEKKVAERTREISRTNKELQLEISERRRVEQELRTAKRIADRSNQAKTDFLANMSHELRTPLNHIIGFTELVVDKHFGDLNPTQEEYLQDVIQSSQHLLSLINDILDLSKIEAKKLVLDRTRISLKQLLENSLTMLKEKAMRQDVTLESRMGRLPNHIFADKRKLKQILYNLLSNAVKFTPSGGTVCLHAELEDNGLDELTSKAPNDPSGRRQPSHRCVRISVTDTGIGIEQTDLELIFKPFEQVEKSTSRQFQGTGLGLSLSRRLVELHGGRIWAESLGDQLGSAFTFTIPILEAESNQPVDP